jgi:hypothetical protein
VGDRVERQGQVPQDRRPGQRLHLRVHRPQRDEPLQLALAALAGEPAPNARHRLAGVGHQLLPGGGFARAGHPSQ